MSASIFSPALIMQVLLLIFGAYLAFRQIRYWIRKSESADWPVATATIDRGTVQFGPVYYCVLEYHYSVAGTSYSGRFALFGSAKGDPRSGRDFGALGAEELSQQWVGRQIIVRYDPADPKISFLRDTELAGRLVRQSPEYVGNA